MMSGGQTTTTLTEEQIQEQAQQQEALFEASLEAEEEKNSEYINSKTIDQIVSAGSEVSKALSLRPKTVEMTDENRDEFVNILSCNIAESGKVEITAASEGIPKSDDKYYYLFEEATYEESIDETKEPVAKIYKEYEWAFKDSAANVDRQKALIRDSALMNNERWLTNNLCADYVVAPNTMRAIGTGKYKLNYQITTTWNDYVANLKEWCTKRALWLSDHT